MLVKKTYQLIKEVNEVKDLCLKQVGSRIEYISDDDFVLSKKMFKLLNTLMEVIEEQSAVIESIDKKLDKLLARKES